MNPTSRFIPANSTEVKQDGIDAVVYTYQTPSGRFCAIAYAGKANKSRWHYGFRTEAQRQGEVESFFYFERERAERKQAERQAAKTFKHSLKVGDILNNSWGYEQTNQDYYQITRTTDKGIYMRQIASRIVDSTGWLAGHVEPIKDQFTGPEVFKRVQGNTHESTVANQFVRMEFGLACLWSGKPDYYSSYA